jgi:hypothetical protein
LEHVDWSVAPQRLTPTVIHSSSEMQALRGMNRN